MNKLPILAALVGALCFTSSANAEQKLRVQVNQRGDFAMIGNTLGWDCGAGAASPVVGSVSGTFPLACGFFSGDSSPDLFWRADAPAGGQATAAPTVSAAQARSTARLVLPPGSEVTHAFLYWGAKRAGSTADTSVVVERPGAFTETVSAVDSYILPDGVVDVVYQSVADVTTLVRANGPGAYRVSGIAVNEFYGANEDVLFAGWSLVVLYRLETEPTRNLAVFDGLDGVSAGNNSDVTLSGFLVPNAGFDAKLGALVYEGDESFAGDSLLFGVAPLEPSDRLQNAQNPVDNFFNGTRSWLGAPVSVAGDLPQLAGTPSTMAGIDIDVVDVTSRVSAGQTSVDLRATSSLDVYYLGAFVTSISTFRPDFTSSTKSVRDLNEGSVQAGDELEYTITVRNTGNDASLGTVVYDPLPAGITFVPGSIRITTGENAGAKTDAAGDDQGFYDAASRSLTVYVGAGATATAGGSIAVGASTSVVFRARVDAGATGVISNQASVEGAGERGAPAVSTATDGNAEGPGTPPTEILVGECTSDAQCTEALPHCDLASAPPKCVACTADDECPASAPVCSAASSCVCPEGMSCLPVDSDEDGIPDDVEIMNGTDPNDADSDDDGVADGAEPMGNVDSDGDGLINALDPDSDDDGLYDGTELGLDCDNPGTNLASQHCVPDGDMGATVTDPLNADTDGGGALDGDEDTNRNGVVDPGERNPTVGFGFDDNLVPEAPDSDGGLPDGGEEGEEGEEGDAGVGAPNPGCEAGSLGCDPSPGVPGADVDTYDSLAGGGGCSVAGTRGNGAGSALLLSIASLALALALRRRRQ